MHMQKDQLAIELPKQLHATVTGGVCCLFVFLRSRIYTFIECALQGND